MLLLYDLSSDVVSGVEVILDCETEATLAAVVELLYTGRCHLSQVQVIGTSCLASWGGYKLDGVDPLMTDPPLTNFTSGSKERKKEKL